MTIPPKSFHALVVSLFAASGGVLSGQPAAGPLPDSEHTPTRDRDKSSYTLLNPTPQDLMREMDTDRPDKTETPHTVDAGHFQIEMDLTTYTQDRNVSEVGDERFTGYSVAPVNLKVGLLNNLDAELVIEIWNVQHLENRTTGTSEWRSGFGDITPRLKYNLWGNDGGETALSLMPFVKLPTNQGHLGNKAVEGGLIIPAEVELPWGFGLGTTFEYAWARNQDNRNYHFEASHSVVLDHEITHRLAGYVELFTSFDTEAGSGVVVTFDTGIAYSFTKNLRLDTGINIGLTRAADDWNPFVGLSWRY